MNPAIEVGLRDEIGLIEQEELRLENPHRRIFRGHAVMGLAVLEWVRREPSALIAVALVLDN